MSENNSLGATAQAPIRVQLSRKKGWRMPPNTVSVARPGPFGNPYIVRIDPLWNGGRRDPFGNPIIMEGPWLCELPGGPNTKPDSVAGMWFATKREAAQRAVDLLRLRVTRLAIGEPVRAKLPSLAGSNLACFCPLDQPCHADLLIELANATPLSGRPANA
jgi:hypothetical protein